MPKVDLRVAPTFWRLRASGANSAIEVEAIELVVEVLGVFARDTAAQNLHLVSGP